MKNNEKDDKSSTANHHANPSHMNPEIAAIIAKDEHSHKDGSKLHEPERDKREAARQIHTNGSTRKGDL